MSDKLKFFYIFFSTPSARAGVSHCAKQPTDHGERGVETSSVHRYLAA